MGENIKKKDLTIDIEISDNDIYEAMKDIPGYLDITPADLKDVYKLAYRHALQRITQAVRAHDIMTTQVFSVNRTTPVMEVAELMAEKTVSGIPVLEEDGKVAGIISEKDFLSHMGSRDKTHFMAVVAECLKGKGCVAMPIRSQKAEDIMTSPAVTVKEDTSVIEIANLFTEKNINRIPVINEEGRLKGIVSRADIVRASLMKTKSKQ
ncbi:MAG: rane protein [Nitrospirae bacterium]|nr:rane protein [Nitrospirota bacterium]